MKSRLWICIPSTVLIAVLGIPGAIIAQELEQQNSERYPHYTVTDLGALPGGFFSQGTAIANNALLGGLATNADGTQHAVLWHNGSIKDIGTPGLGGPNSAAFGINENRQATGLAETPNKDPNGEDFCGYGTFLVCQPFLWQNGAMMPLPTLGGQNGEAGQINSHGAVAGNVENTTPDSTCPSGVPQIFEEKPVVWEHGEVRKLNTFPNDPDGWAFGINDQGQVVGASGECGPLNPQTGVYILSRHPLLWDKHRTIYLPTLGGTGAFGPGNVAQQINNQGQVAGVSDLPGDETYHGFLWAENTRILDLKTLPGDFASAALGINDSGEIVGVSLDADFNPRAFLWRSGRMIDLNQRAPNSPLHLLIAHSINSHGEITGFGVDSTGDVHAFSAIPCDRYDTDQQRCAGDRERGITEWPKALPASVRHLIQQRLSRRSYLDGSHQ
jgi:probable HAF family extracellular repeat protein